MTNLHVDLAHKADTYNFYVGCPVTGTISANGRFTPHTRWGRLKAQIAAKWRHWTRWWRPRYIVTEVDLNKSSVSIREQRWSWVRWGWM